jgi:hypothetical protein
VFDCVSCNGRGCNSCNGGRFELTTCARKIITPDVWRALKWSIRASKQKILPADGGGFSQSASFLSAWDFIAAECQAWDAKLGIKGNG